MFWTSKYCPHTLHDIIKPETHYFHKQIAKKLLIYFNKSIDTDSMDTESMDTENTNKLYEHPTLYLFGSTSSGKWTYARLILQHLFGDCIYNVRKKKIQLHQHEPEEIVVSQYHCEFYESTFLNYKPNSFKKIIKSLGENRNIFNKGYPYYILCQNMDKWSTDYHRIIKEASETYPETLRFIITSHIHIPRLINLSTLLRIPQPKLDEIITCLTYICKTESIEFTKTIEQKVTQKIQNSADSSYREILLWFQEKTISGSWRNMKRIKKIELKHIINLLFTSNSLTSLLQLREFLLEYIAFGKIEKLPRYLMDKICHHPSLSHKCIADCIAIISKFDTRIKLHHRNHIHYEGMIYELFYCIHHKDYNTLNENNENKNDKSVNEKVV